MEWILYIIGNIVIWWLCGLLAVILELQWDRYYKIVPTDWSSCILIWFFGTISLFIIIFKWIMSLFIDLVNYLKIPRLHFWIYQKLTKKQSND